jgi:DNA polymerase IV
MPRSGNHSAEYPLYQRFSEMARKIYLEYTDKVEPFGIDESWLDVTGSAKIYGDGEKIAREINRRVKEELGITVSVGVSGTRYLQSSEAITKSRMP